MWRYVAGFLAIAAIVGFGWVFSLPDKAQCVASGRTVDPTERHCDAADGSFQQLEEHALFHSRDVTLGVTLLLGIGYGVARLVRRRKTQ